MTEEIWLEILTALKGRLPGPHFKTWVKPVRFVSFQDDELLIATPNQYAKNWLEKNALSLIREELAKRQQSCRQVTVIVGAQPSKLAADDLPLLAEQKPVEPSPPAAPSKVVGPLNPKYTFETFIVGNNNRLAFAAAQVVSDRPGEVYNPLCLYGGVGLGKTHLMQAIGNAIHQRLPVKNIVYTSCENFTNDFITALRAKEIGKFKTKYRGSDVLLIDDIQFLSNKEGTQEEFFHTFNLLHQANRQIVITSDRVPKDIPDLEERLSSRFGWGMVADIQSPNYETRLAILTARADQLGVNIAGGVLEFIAETVVSNVRELEGCLTKLIANAAVEKAPMTVEFAHLTLKDIIKPIGVVSAKKIIAAVCRHFQIEPADLISRSRVAELVYPRQAAMYLMRVNANLSLAHIGEAFGGKDHTTVIHSVRKIAGLVKSSSEVQSDLKEIVNVLYRS